MHAMQERGMESDPRYSQLLSLMRSKPPNLDMADIGHGHQPPGPSLSMSMGSMPGVSMGDMQSRGSPAPSMLSSSTQKALPFSSPQLLQLRAQIMAYKLLARNQPLPEHIRSAIQGKAPVAKPTGVGMLSGSGPSQPSQMPSMSPSQAGNQVAPQNQAAMGGGSGVATATGPVPNQTAYNVPGMTPGKLQGFYFQLAESESTIHVKIYDFFVCPPKFCISIVSSFFGT